MKKIILILVLTVFSLAGSVSHGQLLARYGLLIGRYKVGSLVGRVDSLQIVGSTFRPYYGSIPLTSYGNLLPHDTTHLRTDVNLKAPLANPTFTGVVKFSTTDTIAKLSDARGMANARLLPHDTTHLSSRIDLKAALANPTFTGVVKFSTTDTLAKLSDARVMANARLLPHDTTHLSSRVDLKLNAADSSLNTTAPNKFATGYDLKVVTNDLADSETGVALKDSSAVAKANTYSTGKMLADGLALPIPDNEIKGLQALGSDVKGLCIFHDGMFTQAFEISDGEADFIAIYIPETTVITGVKWVQYTQGNYTADNINGFALYTVTGTNYHKVDSTADDGNLWKVAQYGLGTKAFVSTYTAVRGVYLLGMLYNESAHTTVPWIYASHPISAINKLLVGGTNIINGYMESQTTLPHTIAGASINGGTNVPALWLY